MRPPGESCEVLAVVGGDLRRWRQGGTTYEPLSEALASAVSPTVVDAAVAEIDDELATRV